MQKKGAALWISVVLYFGIGIVILTIILTAGLPVINKLRDKNVVIQTKEVMHTLDENIREVIKEGPGSQRVLTINIKKGTIAIDNEHSTVTWKYEGSKIPISEPPSTPNGQGIEVPEGKLIVRTDNGAQDGTYNINIILNYADIPASLTTERASNGNFIGISDLVIRNNGLVTSGTDQVIQVSISQTNA